MHVLRRIGQAVVCLVIVSIVIWALMAIAPGDPATRILNARGINDPTPEQVGAVRAENGLDRPAVVQYLSWMAGLARFDLGTSWASGRPISGEFFARVPATVLLAGVALIMALALASIMGIPAATWGSRWPDRVSRLLALLMLSVPSFLIGIVLIELVTLRWGWGTVIADGTAQTVLLPAFTLALGPAAAWSRLLRTSLLETRSAAFLAVARGRGATGWYLLTRHLLPHALAPMLTVTGLSTAAMLGGAPVVETVFTWPGVGLYTVQAIETRDLPVVAATTVYAVLVYLVVSFLTDLGIFHFEPHAGGGA